MAHEGMGEEWLRASLMLVTGSVALPLPPKSVCGPVELDGITQNMATIPGIGSAYSGHSPSQRHRTRTAARG